MLEQTFKNIDDILHKDAGCSSELDHTELGSTVSFFPAHKFLKSINWHEPKLD